VPVTADLNWDLWRFGYEYDFVAGDRASSVSSPTQTEPPDCRLEHRRADVSKAPTSPAPIINLGVIVRVYPHRVFSITAEYTGFKVFGFVKTLTDRISEDLDVKVNDFDIYGTVNFGRHVGAQAGYRSLTSDYSIDDDEGDLKMKGLLLRRARSFLTPTASIPELPVFEPAAFFGRWELEVGS
jgi:hypothetical protein